MRKFNSFYILFLFEMYSNPCLVPVVAKLSLFYKEVTETRVQHLKIKIHITFDMA